MKNSFLFRHPNLSVRKSEGFSQARVQGMNRSGVDEYFRLLPKIMEANDLLAKPSCIVNMDETELQLNRRPGFVIAEKGSKAVPVITSSEKGKTIIVLGCCNDEGMFLPYLLLL